MSVNRRKKRFVNPIKIEVTRRARMETILGKSPATSSSRLPIYVGSHVIFLTRRNLSRGYSRQDLNLSYLSGQRYALQNKVEEVKNEVQHKVEEVHDTILRWEEQSKEMIISFLHMFSTPDKMLQQNKTQDNNESVEEATGEK